MFEKASRFKFRFQTPQGAIGVEELWEIPMTGRRGGQANLDDIARDLHKQLKSGDDVSFVLKEKKSDAVTQAKFDIVKHVIDVRLAENEAALKVRENAERKQRILSLIAEKQDKALSEKSEAELRALAESL